MGISKFNVLVMLLIFVFSQYVMFTPVLGSINYDFIGPAELVEYRETLVLTNATELITALNSMFALGLTETKVTDLSEELERVYLQLFPDGTFHDLEWFLLKINDQLNLKLSVDDIRTFERMFWSEVEKAKEYLTKSLGDDVLSPAESMPMPLSMPLRDESAPYLHGKNLVAIILVDDASKRIKWNWISEEILKFNIKTSMKYLQDRAPKEAKVSFLGKIYRTKVSSIIDPLNEMKNPGAWMNEAVRNLGYHDVDDMAKKLKNESEVDNVVLVFVPHKSGWILGGYALPAPFWGYGERACVFFFLIDLFGIGIPTPFSVYVHEILHLYGALDEYQWGPPKAHQTYLPYPPLYELWPKSNIGWPLIPCIMDSPLLYWFLICTRTRGQIGWNDYDGDGVLDPLDPDPRKPHSPWEYIFDIPPKSAYEVKVDINLTSITLIGDFAPLVWALVYPQPYVNFYVLDPNGRVVIKVSETVNCSFSFNVSIAGTYRFRFENPTSTPIHSMRLRLAMIVSLSVEPEPLKIFSVNLTICDKDGRPLSGIPVSVVSSTADYIALQLTDVDGKLNLWLPEGSYFLKATYMNSTILNARINVYSNYTETFYVSLPTYVATKFEVSNLMINPREARIGEEIAISINVRNIGEEKGTFTVVLKINGKIEASRNVTLAGGESKIVTFIVVKDIAGTYKVEVNGLSGSFVVKAPLLQPAEFRVIELLISPTEVKPGEVVLITAKVANVGDETGSYTVKLKIADVIVDSRKITLAGRETTIIKFEVIEHVPGIYDVEVDGQKGTFVVRETPPLSIEPWWLYVGVVIIAIAVLTVTTHLIKR